MSCCFAAPLLRFDMRESPADFELVTVKAGVRSIRSRAYRETFHPVVGPIAEARALHVAQQRLVLRAQETQGRFVIWDVGLGAAANAVAVIEAFRDFAGAASIELHSFDQNTAALEFALRHGHELGYLATHIGTVRDLLSRGTTVAGAVVWMLHLDDFCRRVRSEALPPPSAVLYDPYSPRVNPDMWTLDHFTELRARLDDEVPCILTNSTRSTAVRATLLLAGFLVGRGEGIGEKEETTIAASHPQMLGEAALNTEWLIRVKASTASAPLRAGALPRRIQAEDLAALEGHPQFTG